MKLLVVVDYQNDFVNGALGFEGADKIDKGIASKIKTGNYDAIVVTYDTHASKEKYLETREGIALPIHHCEKDSFGHSLYGETKIAIDETNIPVLKINKPTFASEPSTMVTAKANLEILTKQKNVESIEFVGLVTNMCVLSQVVCWQGLYPEAQMIVDASLVDSFNKELHEKALDVMEGLQAKVINR